MDQEKKSRIEKYIKGLSDDFERSEMESMFLSGDSDLDIMREKDFHRMMSEQGNEEINLDHLLDRIYHNIGIREQETKMSGFHRIKRGYMTLAAVVLLPLLLTSIWLVTKKPAAHGLQEKTEISQTTIYAPLGSRVSFDLPDGTSGMLNSGSSISYSLPFSENRNLDLSGEGWFEVKEDPEHAFVINTLTSSITVLGTSFNLSAYPDQDYVELVLNKGMVEFFDKTSNETVNILPEERLVSKNGHIKKTFSDTSRYNGWTEGKLIFKGDSMEEVARRISRWYNVEIILEDSKLKNYSFRGIFKDDRVEDILAYLAMTSPIKYEIIPREMLSDGTYGKGKIIISIIE